MSDSVSELTGGNGEHLSELSQVGDVTALTGEKGREEVRGAGEEKNVCTG